MSNYFEIMYLNLLVYSQHFNLTIKIIYYQFFTYIFQHIQHNVIVIFVSHQKASFHLYFIHTCKILHKTQA